MAKERTAKEPPPIVERQKPGKASRKKPFVVQWAWSPAHAGWDMTVYGRRMAQWTTFSRCETDKQARQSMAAGVKKWGPGFLFRMKP